MTQSDNDPEPSGGGRPPVWIAALIAVIVTIVVVLHLTGVVGG